MGLFSWLKNIFSNNGSEIRLGFYGAPNAGKTSLANKISMDWLGEEVGKASEVPHETREVQKKEKVRVEADGKELSMNLLDMPGISTHIDYKDFSEHKIKGKKAKERAKEATAGVIEAIKWLDDVDVVLAVMDSTDDPYNQVNITILGNLEARKIPIIIVANKTDLKKSDVKRIRDAFPQHTVIPVSAKTGKNLEELYKTIAEVKGN